MGSENPFLSVSHPPDSVSSRHNILTESNQTPKLKKICSRLSTEQTRSPSFLLPSSSGKRRPDLPRSCSHPPAKSEGDKLRASRTAVSAADIANDFTLGVEGEAFVFSQCHKKVTVAEAAGLTGEITQAEEFIREYVQP